MFYIDTSAFVKLVATEESSTELRDWVASSLSELVASDLLRIEALRAARRLGPDFLAATREALQHVTLIALSTGMCEVAADLDPSILRSLDAAHLATALSVGDELEGIVIYDERLAMAARALGLGVLRP